MDKADQTQRYNNSGSGGGIGGVARSSKNPKQKKAPQRGLGVAQLEKIRLEEQQKKDVAAILSPPASVSQRKSSFLSLPIPTYHHSNPSSCSIPFPSPSLPDLSSRDLLIRPPQPAQNNDEKNSSTVNSGGFEAGWLGISVPGLGCVPKLWNSYEYNLEKENSGMDPRLAFRSNLNLPYESDNHIWPPPSLMPRTQQYQQQPMVNVSSGTSSSSVLNFRMEPPSNQSYHCNYSPMWPPEEVKMVGTKRLYPFSLDNSSGPSSHYKLPSLVVPVRSDESASCENVGMFNFEGSNSILRERPSWSTSISNSKLNSNKSIKENEVIKGEFLSLSPRITSTCPSSNFMQHSACLASQDPGFRDESLPYQGIVEDPIIKPAGSSLLNQQPPFYYFLPPAKEQIGKATTTMNNCNGGVGERIDLNLKL
ncbi:uncharacterized protein LOC121235167 isoform X1 [Juglans microcarpa x Juglans regia]|uniref:uncharacterized protein LOC121235167 isoform X1 n=2 Tax=Juglans microcarpa x Juglans regia TaxID=2249226 RepID=UPI001B7E6C0A|nr:uncharacterized protein LOC121235167 isoform X1 [Juglans microcarpa x Juglans regia]XP_040987376.1 uncharacterized protein LOC121235167 isoform X1 [Juglans microcarpa x Juglans regia]XP_040987377.1 uncharacterized protein LOC121235167 isoform X1 [Juglans microcarpa x Juglans regia]XP_040987378.1 uncharacterized protein LOC121235167 isoform X1 [Juglans microcarpa x Juglans regia]